MNVVVECDSRSLDVGDLDELSRIVHLVADGWHDWAGPDPKDDYLQAYLAAHENHRTLLEKSFIETAAYGPSTTPLRVLGPDATGDGRRRLPLRTARRFLAQPVRVFVENGKSDSAFLCALVEHADPELANSVLADPSGPAQLTHGGGKSELINQLEVYIESMSNIGLPIRAIVIVDSDARYPGHVDHDTNRVESVCRVHEVAFHILFKRAIENYIPDDVLERYALDYPDLSEAVGFVCGLSDIQRDHYPMKRGLVGDLADGEKSLYSKFLAQIPTPKLKRIAEYWHGEVGMFTQAGVAQRKSSAEASAIARLIREVL